MNWFDIAVTAGGIIGLGLSIMFIAGSKSNGQPVPMDKPKSRCALCGKTHTDEKHYCDKCGGLILRVPESNPSSCGTESGN